MALKKRTIAAIIAILIVLAMIIAILTVNYINYSKCTDSGSEDKQGCYFAESGNKTASTDSAKIRLDIGTQPLEAG